MKLKSDFLIVTSSRFVTALTSLIAIRLVTSILSPEQYGQLALMITVQMFCGLFLINPVGQFINLHTHQWSDDGTLFARLKSFRSYIFAVAFFGGLFSLLTINDFNIINALLVFIAMTVMVISSTWNATLIPMLNMLGYRQCSAILSITTAITSLILSVILVTNFSSSISWFTGQAFGLAIGAIGANCWIKKQLSSIKNQSLQMDLLNIATIKTYCLPLAIATGLMWLQLSGYRFIIERFWGLSELGLMVIGMQLSNQLFALVESLFMQFFYPLFYRRATDYKNTMEVESAFSDLLNTLGPIYIILTGFTIFCAPYLLKLLVSTQYQNTAIFFIFGSCIELCRVLANLLSNVAQVKRNTQSLALPYFIGAFFSISLIYYAGILNVNIYWTCTALLVGSISMLLVMLHKMYMQINFSLDAKPYIASSLTSLILIAFTFFQNKTTSLTHAILTVSLLGLIMISIISFILRNSESTKRLLNVNLNEKNS